MRSFKIFLFFVGLLTSFYLPAQNKIVKVKTERNPDKSVSFYYEKNLPGSYYIILEFNDLENANRPTFKKVIKHSSGSLFKLKPLNNDSGISFSYKYKYAIGEPNPKIDSLFQYSLPFKVGSKVGAIINTNFYGEEFLESEKKPSWYSLKLYSKTEDTVLCMRKGLVVKIRDKYISSTKGKIVTTKSNSITIEHPDGTLGNYYGFKKDNILVKLGQKVYPHTKLGLVNKKNNDMYSFTFRSFYISDNETLYNEDRKLKDIAKGKKYVIPYFKTPNGLEQLESKKTYIVEFDEEMFFKEFSKKEKKKYLKSLKKQ